MDQSIDEFNTSVNEQCKDSINIDSIHDVDINCSNQIRKDSIMDHDVGIEDKVQRDDKVTCHELSEDVIDKQFKQKCVLLDSFSNVPLTTENQNATSFISSSISCIDKEDPIILEQNQFVKKDLLEHVSDNHLFEENEHISIPYQLQDPIDLEIQLPLNQDQTHVTYSGSDDVCCQDVSSSPNLIKDFCINTINLSSTTNKPIESSSLEYNFFPHQISKQNPCVEYHPLYSNGIQEKLEEKIQSALDPEYSISHESELCNSISAFCATDVYLSVGFLSGHVMIVTLEGVTLTVLKHHESEITDLSFNSYSTFLGSSGKDGRICVYELKSMDQNNLLTHFVCHLRLQFFHPVHMLCLSICPMFHTNPKTRLIIAGNQSGELILYTRTNFYSSNTVLHCGEGLISSIAWNPFTYIIAWTNNIGTKVMDIHSQERISFIPKIESHLQTPLYIVWINKDLLAIGDQTVMKIGQLRYPDTLLSSNRTYLDIIFYFNTPRMICGLGPFQLPKDDAIDTTDNMQSVLMTSNEGIELSPSSIYQYISILTCPNHWDITRHLNKDHTIVSFTLDTDELNEQQIIHYVFRYDGMMMSSDIIDFKNKESLLKHRCIQMIPSSFMSFNNYIVTPTEIIQATYARMKQRLYWYIQQSNYQEALALLKYVDNPDCLMDIIESALKQALQQQQMHQAILIVSQFDLQKYPDIMKLCINLFDEFGFLERLIPQLPLPPLSIAQTHIWDSIAEDLAIRLAERYPFYLRKGFDLWIQYSLTTSKGIEHVVDVLEELIGPLKKLSHNSLHDPIRTIRLECLGMLVERLGMIIEAFEFYIFTKSTSLIFSLLDTHLASNSLLAEKVMEHLPELFRLETKQTIHLLLYGHSLITHSSSTDDEEMIPPIPISQIGTALKHHREYLHFYLKACFDINPQAVKPFFCQQISLFAEYDPSHLLFFLQRLNNLEPSGLKNPAYALAICRRRQTDLHNILKTQKTKTSSELKRHNNDRVSLGLKNQTIITHDYITNASSTYDFTIKHITADLTDILTAEVYLLYILGRMKDALKILIIDLKDILAGLQLVMSVRDPELWSILIKIMEETPEYLEILLSYIDTSQICSGPKGNFFFTFDSSDLPHLPIAPVHILRRLTSASFERIPNIADKLKKLFKELFDQEVIHEFCFDSIADDYEHYGENFVSRLMKGVVINCPHINHSSIIRSSLSHTSSPVMISQSHPHHYSQLAFTQIGTHLPTRTPHNTIHHLLGLGMGWSHFLSVAGPDLDIQFDIVDINDTAALSGLTLPTRTTITQSSLLPLHHDVQTNDHSMLFDTTLKPSLGHFKHFMVNAGKSIRLMNVPQQHSFIYVDNVQQDVIQQKKFIAYWMTEISVCCICGKPLWVLPQYTNYLQLDTPTQQSTENNVLINNTNKKTINTFYNIIIFHCQHCAHRDCYRQVQSIEQQQPMTRQNSIIIKKNVNTRVSSFHLELCYLCAKTPNICLLHHSS